jgi:hypothetical protein
VTWTTPKTWAVGDPATAADFNTYIRDNAAYLFGDSAWISPVYANGWADFLSGWDPVGYKRIGSTVVFRGAMKSGTVAAASFTITGGPPTYRPPANHVFQCNNNANANCGVSITAAGVLATSAGASNVFVDLGQIEYQLS